MDAKNDLSYLLFYFLTAFSTLVLKNNILEKNSTTFFTFYINTYFFAIEKQWVLYESPSEVNVAFTFLFVTVQIEFFFKWKKS